MNIIKNKNFKNHKKVLLIGAFIVCQLFAVSVRPSNSPIYIAKAQAPNYQQATNDLKEIGKKSIAFARANLNYLKQAAQKLIVGFSGVYAQVDPLVKTLVAKYNADNPGHHVAPNVISTTIDDPYKLVGGTNQSGSVFLSKFKCSDATHVWSPIHRLSRYITYISVLQYVIQNLIMVWTDHLNTTLNDAALNMDTNDLDEIKNSVSIINREFSAAVQAGDTSIMSRSELLSKLINNLNKTLDKAKPGYLDALKAKYNDPNGPIGKILESLNDFKNLPHSFPLVDAGEQTDPLKVSTALISFINDFIAKVATCSLTQDHFNKILLGDPALKLNLSLTAYQQQANQAAKTNILNIIDKIKTSDIFSDNTKRKILIATGNTVANIIAMGGNLNNALKVDQLLDYTLESAFSLYTGFGSISRRLAGLPVGTGASPKTSGNFNKEGNPTEIRNLVNIMANYPWVFPAVHWAPYNGLANNAYNFGPGAIIDSKKSFLLSKSIMNIRNFAVLDRYDGSGNLDDTSFDSSNNFLQRLTQLSSGDCESKFKIVFSNPGNIKLATDAEWKPAVLNPATLPSIDYTKFFPVGFLFNPSKYNAEFQAIFNGINFEKTGVTLSNIQNQANQDTSWGKYTLKLKEYINSSLNSFATKASSLENSLGNGGTGQPVGPQGGNGGEDQPIEQRRDTPVSNNVNELVNNLNAILTDQNLNEIGKVAKFWQTIMVSSLNDTQKNEALDSNNLNNTLKNANYKGLFNNYTWYNTAPNAQTYAGWTNLAKIISYILKPALYSNLYESTLPQVLRNGAWKTITPTNFGQVRREVVDLQNRNRAQGDDLWRRICILYPGFDYNPFNNPGAENNPDIFKNTEVLGDYIDMRLPVRTSDFNRYVRVANVRDYIMKLWTQNFMQVPVSNDGVAIVAKVPGGQGGAGGLGSPYGGPLQTMVGSFDISRPITIAEFWSAAHSDADRAALRSYNSWYELIYNQPEYLNRSAATGILSNFDFRSLTTMTAWNDLGVSQKNEIASRRRPLFDMMFSHNLNIPELTNVDILQILYRAYSSDTQNLADWTNLNTTQKSKLQEINRFFKYPPFVDQNTTQLDLSESNLDIIDMLPTRYRNIVKPLYIQYQQQKEDREYFRYRDYDDDDYESSDDKFDKEMKRYTKTRLRDLGNVYIGNAVEKAINKIDPIVFGSYCTQLLEGTYNSLIKPRKDSWKRSDYSYYDIYDSKKQIFAFYVAMSSFLSLKRLYQGINDKDVRTKLKQLIDVLSDKLTDAINKYYSNSDTNKNLKSVYEERMKSMLNRLKSLDLKDSSEREELKAKELILGMGSLFNIDSNILKQLFRNDLKNLKGIDIEEVHAGIARAQEIIKGFWDRLSDYVSSNEKGNEVLFEGLGSQITYALRLEQIKNLKKLFNQFAETQLDIASKTSSMVTSMLSGNGNEDIKETVRKITETNKEIYANKSSFISSISALANRYNEIEKKNKDLFGRTNYDDLNLNGFDTTAYTSTLEPLRDVYKQAAETFKQLFRRIREADIEANRERKGKRRNYEEDDRIENFKSAREEYSKNQKDLVKKIINVTANVCNFFKRPVWNNLRSEHFSTIQTALGEIFRKMTLNVSEFEEDLKDGKRVLPRNIGPSSSYGFEEYDYTLIDETKETKNPYVIIRKALEENDKDLAELSKTNPEFSSAPKSGTYMRLIMDYISAMYNLKYFGREILKECLAFSTYSIKDERSVYSRGTDGGRSLSDMGYKYDDDKDPVDNIKDIIEVMVKEFDSLNARNRFIIDGGNNSSSNRSDLAEVKNALEKLKQNTNNLTSIDDPKIDTALSKLEEEKENKEEEESAVENQETQDDEETPEDPALAEDDVNEMAEEPLTKTETPVEQEDSSVPQDSPEDIEVNVLAHSRAEQFHAKFEGTVNATTGAIHGTVKCDPARHRFSGSNEEAFAVVFENGNVLREADGKTSKKIALTKQTAGVFTVDYTPVNPQALVELHLYGRGHEQDVADGVMRERTDHFGGSFAISSLVIDKTPNGDMALNAGPALSGNDQPIGDENIKNIKYIKKPNGDIIVKFKNINGNNANLVFCPVPKEGKVIKMNFEATRMKKRGYWIVQIPAHIANDIKELHTYEDIENADHFKYKVALDVNNIRPLPQRSAAQPQPTTVSLAQTNSTEPVSAKQSAQPAKKEQKTHNKEVKRAKRKKQHSQPLDPIAEVPEEDIIDSSDDAAVENDLSE